MTFQEMIEDVQYELSHGEQKSPDRAMIVRRLNRAKNWLFGKTERRGGRELYLQTSSVAIAEGDASFNFPSGASRLVSIRQTEPEPECDWEVVDIRRATEHRNRGVPIVFVQGTVVRFANEDGAPYAATIEVAFTGPPADLTDTSASTQTFSYFPAEYHDAIVLKAASDLCDPTTDLSGTLMARLNDRISDIEKAADQRHINQPMRVKNRRLYRYLSIRRD